MKQPVVFGRKLPRNDFEGDDFTPGAHGAYVTCMDTASGRMVAWATNGRVDEDGRVYREALHPHDSDGITLVQAKQAIHAVAGLDLVIRPSWTLAAVRTHLRYGRGLIVLGRYSALPREYRYQAYAAFDHAMWVSHRSMATGNIRVWDPLNPDIHGYGRWMPADVVYRFMATRSFESGFVPLEPL